MREAVEKALNLFAEGSGPEFAKTSEFPCGNG
jgi:hypothetical protein